jgi:hypothetical protein
MMPMTALSHAGKPSTQDGGEELLVELADSTPGEVALRCLDAALPSNATKMRTSSESLYAPM